MKICTLLSAMMLVLCSLQPGNVLSQCPFIEAILVNSCTSPEPDGEFVIINSGDNGFNTNDLGLKFPFSSLGFSPHDNFINLVTPFPIEMGDSTPCSLQVGVDSMIGGCPNVIPVGAGYFIPPHSYLVLQTSAKAKGVYDFSHICGQGECIYVIRSTCERFFGAFGNSSGILREVSLVILNSGCEDTHTYDAFNWNNVNGDYFIPPATYGNDSCVAPPIASPGLAPIILPIVNMSSCGMYILPTIEGENLSDTVAYYTSSSGQGNQYLPGDTLTTSTSLYAFDIGPTCAQVSEVYFEVIVSQPIVIQDSIVVPDNGSASGSIMFNLDGGIPPFSFLWNNGEESQTLVDVVSGEYSISITDSIGCEAEFGFIVPLQTSTYITSKQTNELTVSPCPTRSGASVQVSLNPNVFTTPCQLRLITIGGDIHSSTNIIAVNGKATFKAPEIAGMYLVELTIYGFQPSYARLIVY